MLKKLLTAAAASAFALTLYAAPAAACPGHDKAKVTKKQDKKDQGTKEAQKKGDSKKKNNKKNDTSSKKKAT